MDLLIIILLILLIFGVAPVWPYSRGWGYPPVLIVVLVLLILVVMGRV